VLEKEMNFLPARKADEHPSTLVKLGRPTEKEKAVRKLDNITSQ
jgi:hypothetical protein